MYSGFYVYSCSLCIYKGINANNCSVSMYFSVIKIIISYKKNNFGKAKLSAKEFIFFIYYKLFLSDKAIFNIIFL